MKSANYCIKDHLQKFLLDKQKFVACKERGQSKRASSEKNIQATYNVWVFCLACAYTKISNCHKDCLFYAALHRIFWFFSIKNGDTGGVSKGVNFTALLYF